MKMETSSPQKPTKAKAAKAKAAKTKATKSKAKDNGSNGPSRPKRPLSAFNLFYRFKRQKALAAIALGKNDIEYIRYLIKCPPGLEDCVASSMDDTADEAMKDLRRFNIRKDLEGQLMPREDTKSRSHRTNRTAMNGAMSFVELGKIMNATWKTCDGFARSVFDELADEGREKYRQRLAEWQKASDLGDDGAAVGAGGKKRKYTKSKQPTTAAADDDDDDDESIKKRKAPARKDDDVKADAGAALTNFCSDPAQLQSKDPEASASPPGPCSVSYVPISVPIIKQESLPTIGSDHQKIIARNQELIARQKAQAAKRAALAPSSSSPSFLQQDNRNNNSNMNNNMSNSNNGGMSQEMMLAKMEMAQQAGIPNAPSDYGNAPPQDMKLRSNTNNGQQYPQGHQHHQQQQQHQQQQFQPQRHQLHNEASLRMRVMELEGQLATEQLQSRIRKLEFDLASHRNIQGQLRAVLDVAGNERAGNAMNNGAPTDALPSNASMQGQQGRYDELTRAQLLLGRERATNTMTSMDNTMNHAMPMQGQQGRYEEPTRAQLLLGDQRRSSMMDDSNGMSTNNIVHRPPQPQHPPPPPSNTDVGGLDTLVQASEISSALSRIADTTRMNNSMNISNFQQQQQHGMAARTSPSAQMLSDFQNGLWSSEPN